MSKVVYNLVDEQVDILIMDWTMTVPIMMRRKVFNIIAKR